MKDLNLSFSQPGLAYFPDFAIYSTFYILDDSPSSHALWQRLAADTDAHCRATAYRTTVLRGVGFELWTAWSKETAPPKGMGTKRKLDEYSQGVRQFRRRSVVPHQV
jgi:hypothetical protein